MTLSRFQLLIILLSFVSTSSCSSYKNTSQKDEGSQIKELFLPPPEFDEETYINPDKYRSEQSQNEAVTTNSAFTPISYNQTKIQRRVNYPAEARSNNIQGKVVLKIYVNKTDEVTNIKVKESPHPLLTEASATAVINTNFKAATLNSKPVNSFTEVPVFFKIWSSSKL